MRKTFLFFARILFSLPFLIFGVRHALNWSDTVLGVHNTLEQWQAYTEAVSWMKELIGHCISQAPLLTGGAIALEIVGGVLIFTNYKLRLGSFFLLLFLIPQTLIAHPFWLEVKELNEGKP